MVPQKKKKKKEEEEGRLAERLGHTMGRELLLKKKEKKVRFRLRLEEEEEGRLWSKP